MQFQSLDGEDPLKESMATLSGILTWRIPMDRGAWRAMVHGVTKSPTQLKRFSMHAPPISNFLLVPLPFLSSLLQGSPFPASFSSSSHAQRSHLFPSHENHTHRHLFHSLPSSLHHTPDTFSLALGCHPSLPPASLCTEPWACCRPPPPLPPSSHLSPDALLH